MWMTCEVCGASVIQGHCYDCYVDSEKEIERLRDIWVDGPDCEAARAARGDFVRRRAGCLCQWEEGDSPCPVHGDTPGLERDLNEAMRGCEGPPGDDGDDVPF
jgi:hypothetical protein